MKKEKKRKEEEGRWKGVEETREKGKNSEENGRENGEERKDRSKG